MAAEESDREDLLREATGLIDRVEFHVPWIDEPIVAGFRRNGALSLFIGQAEVYQFDTSGRWRRGYHHGCLLKAVDGHLVQMHRVRSREATELVSQRLTADQEQESIARLSERLRQLTTSIAAQEYNWVGQVSTSENPPLERLAAWLGQRPVAVEIAATPRLK